MPSTRVGGLSRHAELIAGLMAVRHERESIVEYYFRLLDKGRVDRDVHGIGSLGQQVGGNLHEQIDHTHLFSDDFVLKRCAKHENPLGVEIQETPNAGATLARFEPDSYEHLLGYGRSANLLASAFSSRTEAISATMFA